MKAFYERLRARVPLLPVSVANFIEVLGKRGDDHFFGRAFFDENENPERVFVSNYQELGYLRRGNIDRFIAKTPRREFSYRS